MSNNPSLGIDIELNSVDKAAGLAVVKPGHFNPTDS
jgi:hypothetical protein